MVNKINTLLII